MSSRNVCIKHGVSPEYVSVYRSVCERFDLLLELDKLRGSLKFCPIHLLGNTTVWAWISGISILHWLRYWTLNYRYLKTRSDKNQILSHMARHHEWLSKKICFLWLFGWTCPLDGAEGRKKEGWSGFCVQMGVQRENCQWDTLGQ